MKPRIMYVELKSGYSDNGPASIGRVTFSKTGKTIYYKGMSFHTLKGRGVCGGNYIEETTGDEYWISGPKKDRTDRHWAGGGPVPVDADAKEEYESLL